jgi:hypothetical protein
MLLITFPLQRPKGGFIRESSRQHFPHRKGGIMPKETKQIEPQLIQPKEHGQWEIYAGAELFKKLEEQKRLHVKPSKKVAGCFDSESLCAWQSRLSSLGIEEAEIVQSIYGFGLRYASGLQDFSIIARAREIGGTFNEAVIFAQKWVHEDPDHRFVRFYRSAQKVAS